MQANFNRGGSCARRGAFTLVELLVVIAIIALLVAILLPALVGARCSARQAQNVTNHKNLVTALANYGGDFRDKLASFSWTRNQAYPVTQPGGAIMMQTFGDDLTAAAYQAIDIIRRRSAPVNDQLTTTMNDWIPHPTYSHLVLMDFLAARMPEPMLVNPSDRYRIDLAAQLREAPNPNQFCQQWSSSHAGVRSTWPYSSSYQFVPCSYTPDRESVDGGSLRSGGDQIFYLFAQAPRYLLGKRKLTDVGFPANKVFLMEDVGRLNCKTEYPFIHPGGTFTITAFDGHIATVKTIEMSRGAYTRANGARENAFMDYNPMIAWGYPAWPGGGSGTGLPARCRWTYKGLKGIDFGAAEPMLP